MPRIVLRSLDRSSSSGVWCLGVLARNHPFVAKILLEFRLPRSVLQESVTSGQKGKIVMVVEEDELQKRQQREGDVSCKGKMISKNLHISKGIRCYGKVRLVTNIQELFYLYLSVVMIVAAVDVEESLDNAYTIVAVLKQLAAIAPVHRHLFMSKAILSTNTTDGAAISRALQFLSSLVATLNGKDRHILSNEDSTTVSLVWDINAALEPLWLELSTCISKMENYSDSAPDLLHSSILSTSKSCLHFLQTVRISCHI
ncbi:hypothetical protein ACH5RR_034797 [Cinchona calisaya]|uniref:Uncharacterized protein n=1 Tax=Cinchona calisaya TaxID=153742 RepID=A0ABD2YE20_9GENT